MLCSSENTTLTYKGNSWSATSSGLAPSQGFFPSFISPEWGGERTTVSPPVTRPPSPPDVPNHGAVLEHPFIPKFQVLHWEDLLGKPFRCGGQTRTPTGVPALCVQHPPSPNPYGSAPNPMDQPQNPYRSAQIPTDLPKSYGSALQISSNSTGSAPVPTDLPQSLWISPRFPMHLPQALQICSSPIRAAPNPMDLPKSHQICPNPIGSAPVPSDLPKSHRICPSPIAERDKPPSSPPWLSGTCPCGTHGLPTEVAPGGVSPSRPQQGGTRTGVHPGATVPCPRRGGPQERPELSSPLAAPLGPGGKGTVPAGTGTRQHRGDIAPPRAPGQGVPSAAQGGGVITLFLDPSKPFWCCHGRAGSAGCAARGWERREGRGGSGVRYFSIPGSAGPGNKGAIEVQPLWSVKQKPPCISSGAFDPPPPVGWRLLMSCRCSVTAASESPKNTPRNVPAPTPALPPHPQTLQRSSRLPNFFRGDPRGAEPSAGGGRSRALRLAFLSCN